MTGKTMTYYLANRWALIAFVALACIPSLLLAQDSPEEMDLIVTAATTKVMSGPKEVLTLKEGDRFAVLKAAAPWYKIEVVVDGKTQAGWVLEKDIRLAPREVDVYREPVDDYLQIASNADVHIGTKVLGVALPDEIYLIQEERTPWIQIEFTSENSLKKGWVLEKQIRRLTPEQAAPSIAGHRPASFREGSLSVDWKTKQITVKGKLPLRVEDATLTVISPDTGEAVTELTRSGKEVTLAVSTQQFASLLTPLTRSLWIREDTTTDVRWHRIDLPGVTIGDRAKAYRYKEFTEGLVTFLPVKDLLPEFVVELQDELTGEFKPLARDKGYGPRALDVYHSKADFEDQIRLILPFLEEGDPQQRYKLRVRNLDGSYSGVVVLQQEGDKVASFREADTAPSAQLVDAVVTLPSVEFLSAAQARSELERVGLNVLFVEEANLNPVPMEAATMRTVGRQGIAPGDSALVGSQVWLSLQSDEPAGVTDSLVADDSSVTLLEDGGGIDLSSMPSTPTVGVDTNSDLGFVEINQGGIVSTGGLVGQDDTSLDNDTLSSVITDDIVLVEGGGITGIDGGLNGIDGSGGIDLGDNSGGTDSGTVIPVNPDPGVLIDPTASQDSAIVAAILKIILQAIFQHPSGNNSLPGQIGNAITQVTQAHEASIQNALPNATTGQDIPVDPLLEKLVLALNLSLTNQQQTDLVTKWQQQIRQRPTAGQLDRNRNGLVSDDIAVWFIIRLVQGKQYNPANNVQLGVDGSGNAIASFGTGKMPLGGSLPIVTPGQANPGIITPSPQTDPIKEVAQGKPLEISSDGPDEVRVPNLADRLVSDAENKLDEVGLGIGNFEELFQSDKTVDSTPESHIWVDSGSKVQLYVVRKVPEVRKHSLADANSMLDRWRFQHRVQGKSANSDIVVNQSPLPGQYVPPTKIVDMNVARLVPNVVDMFQKEAISKLDDHELGWRSDTRAFTADKVVEQNPVPGELAERGDQVELTVHLKMPNVTGMTLSKAKQVLEDWDLVSNVPNRWAFERDTVRGQSIDAGKYVPHRSMASLDPVKGIVPNVKGRKISEARDRLDNQENYPAEVYGDVWNSDRVTMQRPEAGTEYERGRKVVIDARVPVPNVYRQNILQARDSINASNGDLVGNITGSTYQTDVVYSQSPSSGTLVFPRTQVSLVPGVNVPSLRGLTLAQADNQLTANNLNGNAITSSTQETTNRALVGRILIDSQSPGPGLYARSNIGNIRLGTVEMILAMRTVPDATDTAASNSINIVRNAGLTPIVVFNGQRYNPAGWAAFVLTRTIASALDPETSRPTMEPVVLEQDPNPGTRVIAGSQVLLYARDRLSK